MLQKRNLLFLSLFIMNVLLLSSCFSNPPATEGIIKGQVMVPEGSIQAKDLTGQALPDATINIINLETGAIIATATTDANGYYQISVPAGGPYLLEAIKDSVKLQQITCSVEIGIEYDLGTADCTTTAAALIAQAMMDAGDNPADIDCAAIIADPNFDDVSSIVCSIIKAGGDPTTSAAIQQAVEDFLYPPIPVPAPVPTPTPTYTVTFDKNDINATGTMAVQAIASGSSEDLTACVFTKAGRKFDGWAETSTGAVAYADGASYTMGTFDVTLYAKWAETISIAAITGVTAPATGVTPVTTIDKTDQYTGTVAWSVSWSPDVPFGSTVYYTATITLTPKADCTLTGVAENFFTVAGTVAINSLNSGVVIARFLVVGASYGGGKVAYIFQDNGNEPDDPGYVEGQTHGLIVATVDQSTGIIWALPDYDEDCVLGGTSDLLGTGSANTDNIIVQNGVGSTYAAGLARAYNGGDHNDWFLPSKDELNKLRLNRVAIGGFVGGYYSFYWSSSECDADGAWLQDFYSGIQYGNYYKHDTYRVRAVRAF